MASTFSAVVFSIVIVSNVAQSSFMETVKCPNTYTSSLLPLVGDTMCSINGVAFEWASDYEIAVIYMTTMWSEFDDPEDSVQGIVAMDGYLTYCVRFKIELGKLAESLRNKPNVNEKYRKAVFDWYQAINTLSQNHWSLPEVFSLGSFKNQFKTSFEHLILNGDEIYKQVNDKELKQEMDDFTKNIATLMIEILKRISKRVQDIPKEFK